VTVAANTWTSTIISSLEIVDDVVGWQRKQRLGVLEQLIQGVRFLDVSVSIGSDDNFHWSHQGIVGSVVDNDLQEIARFVKINQQELVVLAISIDAESSMIRKRLVELLERYFEEHSLKEPSNPIRLKDMMDRGKTTIVVTRDSELSALSEYVWNYSFIASRAMASAISKDSSKAIFTTKPFYSSRQDTHIIQLIIVTVVRKLIIFSLFFGSLLLILIVIHIKITNITLCTRILFVRFFKLCFVLKCIIAMILLHIILQSLFYKNTSSNSLSGAEIQNTENTKDVVPCGTNNTCLMCKHFNFILEDELNTASLKKENSWNVALVDDITSSSVVDLCINANIATLNRYVVISFEGSPICGSGGIRQIFTCPPIILTYVIVSHDESRVITWYRIRDGDSVVLHEGVFPMDSNILLSLGTALGSWISLYVGNLQSWINDGSSLYVRGSENKHGQGMAYVSHTPGVLATSCRGHVLGEVLNLVRWDNRT
jgi:hypothetical protein